MTQIAVSNALHGDGDARATLNGAKQRVSLLLKPIYDHGQADCIDVRMSFDAGLKDKGHTLFDHVLMRGPTRTTQYTAADVRLHGSSGNDIGLYTTESKDGKRRHFVLADACAPDRLTVAYRAKGRPINESTPCGPQIALESDGGGLSACGQGFLLALSGGEKEVVSTISIVWDLSGAPNGTRAVCTFGEGTSITIREKPSCLEETFFMVGPVNSYPAETTDRPFGLYWLSQPPLDTQKIGSQLEAILPQVQKLFDDPNELFRIFIRRNAYKCISGRGLHQGFVFAWNTILSKDEDGMTEFLFHEIMHNWPRLGASSPDGIPTREDLAESWWNEGIAEYLSLIIPHRLGVFTEAEFVYKFNRRISNYYTNPDRALKNDEIMDNFWKGGHANRIPYQRGFMYFVLLAHQLHRASKRSLDTLMLIMVKLRRTGQPHNFKVWQALLVAELGEERVMADYRSMSNAELVRLPPDCMGTFIKHGQDKWQLVRQDQEEYYLGFPEACLGQSRRKVEGLDPESRAAKAGVVDGDAITSKFSYPTDAEQWDKNFIMTVKRDELLELAWWPRSFQKVESYQFVKTSE